MTRSPGACESPPVRRSIRRYGPVCTRPARWHVRRIADDYAWNLCGNHAAHPRRMAAEFIVTPLPERETDR